MGRLTAFSRPRFLQDLAGTEKPHPCGHPLNRPTAAVQPIAGRKHQKTGTETHEHMHAQAVRVIATGAEAVEPHSDATGHRRTHAPERVEVEIGGAPQRGGEEIGRQHGRQRGRARTMAAIVSFGVNGNLLRQSLRLGLSVLITCAIAQHFQRITYLWYPLLAVTFVVDDQDDNSLRAARGRILGTITGGLVTFVVHTILSGWIGILVSLLISIPLLRRLGWSSGLSTAAVITIMFLGIPGYALLNWSYVFNRSVDTVVGIVVALLMGRLFWPKNRLARMQELSDGLVAILHRRLNAHSAAFQGRGPAPEPIDSEAITRSLLELQRLINVEESLGPRHIQRLRQRRWPQRMSLLRCLQVRWLLVERLLERLRPKEGRLALPELGRYLDLNEPMAWQALVLADHPTALPLPQRIALEEEITRLRLLVRSQKRLDTAVAMTAPVATAGVS